MVDDAKASSLTVFLGFRIVRSAHGVPALISPACVEMLRDEGDSYPAALAAAGTDVDLARWGR